MTVSSAFECVHACVLQNFVEYPELFKGYGSPFSCQSTPTDIAKT
jgi:hypothetical protein